MWREGANGKRVIAILMLFTGLSATIFWPILTLLNDNFGWRVTFLVSAGLHFFVCLPLHLFGLPKPVAAHTQGTGAETPPVELSPADRRRAFMLIAVFTTLCTFVTFSVSTPLIEIFRQSGASRYRHWLTHKLGTWHDQFGMSGCVGCGRCIAWCPTGIDITAEMNKMAGTGQDD